MNLGQSSTWIPLFSRVPGIPQVTQPPAVVPVRIALLCSLLKQPLPKWMPGIRPTILSFAFSTAAEAWRKLPPSSSPPHPPSPPPRPTHRDVRKEADQMKALRNDVSSLRFALPSISHRSTSKERGEGFLPYNWCSSATASYLRTFSHLRAPASWKNERWRFVRNLANTPRQGHDCARPPSACCAFSKGVAGLNLWKNLITNESQVQEGFGSHNHRGSGGRLMVTIKPYKIPKENALYVKDM